ncbi:MAG: pitrilysin family protein [Myxococcota bacterium]
MTQLLVEAPLGDLVARKHRLDNGLDVILVRDARSPVVAYQTWVRVGSRHEQPGKTGLAHLFEHLMFNESENQPAGAFDRTIEAIGGETNASTWVDWTFYQTNVAREHLDMVARLEAERFAHLVLRAPQVTSEREVVANERRFRVDDDVDGFLSERLYALAFESHPYHWPTIGWMEDIQSFTPEDCATFYRRFYAPNNTTVVLVGGLEEAEALATIESSYGALAPQPLPTADIVIEGPIASERRACFHKPVMSDKLYMGWRSPPLVHPDHPPLEVLNEILFGGQSSRLWRGLVVDEIASSVSGGVGAFHDPGLFEIHATLKRARKAVDAESLIDAEIARLHDEPVLASEIEKAQARLESSFQWGLRSANGKAQALGHFEATTGDFRNLLRVAEGYQRVSADDVRRVARTHLRPEARCVLVAEPT